MNNIMRSKYLNNWEYLVVIVAIIAAIVGLFVSAIALLDIIEITHSN